MNYSISIDSLLNRLDKVRANGLDKWMACCPAHDDRSPSMSITTGDDGRILMHCFAGCHFESITKALGLNLTDLFKVTYTYTKKTNIFPRNKLETALLHEKFVLCIAIKSREMDFPIHPDDKGREQLARKRIAVLTKELSHA